MATEPTRPVPGAAQFPAEADHRPRITAEDHAHEDHVQEDVIDELRQHSPEGPPPHRTERLVSTGVLIILAVLVLITIVGVVAAFGGWAAGLLAAGFVIIAYLLAGAPILYASLMRSNEETATRRILTGEDMKPRPPRI